MTDIESPIESEDISDSIQREENPSAPSDSTDENITSTDEQNENTEGTNINLSVVHPLEYEWTFWYDKRPLAQKRVKGEQESYESNLRDIGTFGTVEDFWRYYNHMVKPSKIENNANYHLFKKGVKPMWEDAANSKGGKWVLTVKGDKTGDVADTIWENVVLSLVGETLDVDNELCGAVYSKRKGGDRIAVWNRSRDNEVAILAIGRKLKQFIGVDASKVQTSYQSHEDSMKSGASYANPSHYRI